MTALFYRESIDSSHIKATSGKGYMEEWIEGFSKKQIKVKAVRLLLALMELINGHTLPIRRLFRCSP